MNILIIFCFCICIVSSTHSETASFFGASFISVPVEEAKSTTEIEFRFLTKRSDTLLFLAAGNIDYLLIKLDSGRIKVQIDLGAGESRLLSPLGLRLDDLMWHNVTVSRKDAELTLIVDNIHVAREKLPGRFFELNIHYGLFIGGQGDFSELFLGHGEWLRGCISDLKYNEIYPLNRARQRLGMSRAHEVSWNCAPEFYASTSSEISFVEEGAFMSLPNYIHRTGSKWELNIKTGSSDGVLLYTSGGGEHSDFVGLEIMSGKVKLVFDKGGGPIEVINEINISDGQWHNVIVNFNPNFAQITVDHTTASVKISHTTTSYFDLDDSIFVGGIELNKRARALVQGLKNADLSFKGCIRNLFISSKPIGLPHAKVTQGILTNCVWSYPCISDPCVTNATCVPKGVNSFFCLCDSPHCVRHDFQESYSVFSKVSQLQLVDLVPLQISEGENTVISTSNVNVVLDYAKYGIRDSGVLFSTVPSMLPSYGSLIVEIWKKTGTLQTFTILDLAKNKVRYVHDGSESTEDVIVLDLEFSPTLGFVLPGYLQGQHRFILPVKIAPTNDPPALVIPTNKILRLAQGTRKMITNIFLNATDPDSAKSSLVYEVINSGNGHLERGSNFNNAITKFSQKEVDEGAIYYFANTSSQGYTKIVLQISDGSLSSHASSLQIYITPISVKLLSNTGAVLTLKSSVLITSANLSAVTNSEDPTVVILFKIIHPCEFGVIERANDVLAKNVTWSPVINFTSSDLAMDQIRYRHLIGNPLQDIFRFTLSIQGHEFSSVHEFRITFKELKLKLLRLSNATLNFSREYFISSDNIFYATTPISTDVDKIIYSVKQLPMFGSVVFKEERLLINDNFTQHDLNSGSLVYKMHRTGYNKMKDKMILQISTEHCNNKPSVELYFMYTPPNNLKHRYKYTVNTVKVMEGGATPISPYELNVETNNIKTIVYEVYAGPFHGVLNLIDPIQNLTIVNITHFTPSQIAAGRILYFHDDSESYEDFIHFIAISNIEDDFMMTGTVNIQVTLVNDNAPKRIIHSVFRIVTGGKRLLTTRNLKYKDDDVDFDEKNLLYIVKNCSAIYSASTFQPITQFTQEDMEAFRVLVIENGLCGNEVALWVTDGTHTNQGILDIRPSPPFIEITNNSHLVVSKGGQTNVTTSNLYSDTNVDVNPESIRYDVLSGPNQGKLILSGNPSPASFTQGQIERGLVSYKHSSSPFSQDRIQLKVSAEGVSSEGSLGIRIFPPAYWGPFIVSANKSIQVEEFTSVLILRDYLMIKQIDVPPSDITYLVVSGPVSGYLEIEGSEEETVFEDEEKGGVRAFDQATIDNGKLYYVQTGSNKTHDSIEVDVTNGIAWLHSLRIIIEILPSKLIVNSKDLTVAEGGSIVLPPSFLYSSVPYYCDKLTDFLIIDHPKHGNIVTVTSNKKVSKMNMQQIQAGSLKYVHDGSETTNDSFVVIGHAGEKESEPATVSVTISPVNDMTPIVVNRTEVKLWRGGHVVITPYHLAAIDKDTPPENITFFIKSFNGGYVAFLEKQDVSIESFTQLQLNMGKVLLVHNGGSEKATFEAIVIDGINQIGPVSVTSQIQEATISLSINNGLHIFPLLKKPITKNDLMAICSDKDRGIFYNVTKQPLKGKLFLNNYKDKIVTNFSQTDVNNGNLWYLHNTFSSEPVDSDYFTFDIYAEFVDPLKDNVFKIDISVFSGGLDQFLNGSVFKLDVLEGGHALIQLNLSSILDFLSLDVGLENPNVYGKIIEPPKHGQICSAEKCDVSSFSTDILSVGKIHYSHDHSDTKDDFFQLSLILEPGDISLCNLTYFVDVTPVNDQPFVVVTENPFINIAQGQQVLITSNDLYTQDPDTEPKDIIYDIIDGPNVGQLIKDKNIVVRFTQEDINKELIFFKHFGALQSTSFIFRVSDGQFPPVYKNFNVHVVKVFLDIKVNKLISILQGSAVTEISVDVFNISSNAEMESIEFNVTSSPKYGVICVNNTPANSFSYKDLILSAVTYKQTDMSIHTDSFEVNVYSNSVMNGPTFEGVWCNVSVKPLIIYGNFHPSSGTKTKIDLSVLDATPLYKLTKSNPIYKVLKKPQYGRLKKIIKTNGHNKKTHEKDNIMKFSHLELLNGIIYYVGKKTTESMEDKVPFLIYCPNTEVAVQPALGELRFRINSESTTTFKPPNPSYPGINSPIGHGGVHMASPNMSDDYLLGVSMITSIIALGLLIVGFARCGTKHANQNNISSKAEMPEPLPKPPEELIATTAYVHTPKKEPINQVPPPVNKREGDIIASSESELNSHYPYGDAEWSSMDSSDVAYHTKSANNPMLRRNQYWV